MVGRAEDAGGSEEAATRVHGLGELEAFDCTESKTRNHHRPVRRGILMLQEAILVVSGLVLERGAGKRKPGLYSGSVPLGGGLYCDQR